MGFEPLDAGSLGDFKLEDLAEDAPTFANPAPMQPQFQPQVVPNMPTPMQSASIYAHRYGPPVLIGGVIGYFVYGWTGALIGALVAGVGYFLLSSLILGAALSSAFQAG